MRLKIRCRPGIDGCDNVFETEPDTRGVVRCPKCKGSFKFEESDVVKPEPRLAASGSQVILVPASSIYIT